MIGFILGEKSVQSQTFNTKGERIPTTTILTSPCFIISIQTPQTRGFGSVLLGYKQVKKTAKPKQGLLEKAGIKTPLRFLKEFRIDQPGSNVQYLSENDKQYLQINEKRFYAGQEIKPTDLFSIGDYVSVSGKSKGKGFQGVVRRHGFKGGPKTHGQSDRQRAPGAIGMTTTPGRVFKGKRMAGRTGGERITVAGLQVVEVADGFMKVKGLVPGAKEGLLEVLKIS